MRRLPAALATLLSILLSAGVVVAVLYLSGRAYLLQELPGWPRPTPRLAGTVEASSAGTYWGAFLPGADADQSVVTAFASKTGRQPAIVSIYQQWSGEPPFPAAAAHRLWQRGTVPLLIWEPWQPGLPELQANDQPRYRLSAIAAGAFDGYVRKYADQVRAYGGPLFMEPLHEMNGNWYPWGGTVNGNSTADFVAAWRHLHDLFRAEGATNATWTWTVNRDTVPDTAANQPGRYWPGAGYVDWVGLDAYNWGPAPGHRWQTVTQTFGPGLAALEPLEKPVILAETGSVEKGGDKAGWIASLYAGLTGEYRDAVAAAVWFDQQVPGYDWRIDTSPPAEAAFAAGVARPGILSAGRVLLSAAGG